MDRTEHRLTRQVAETLRLRLSDADPVLQTALSARLAVWQARLPTQAAAPGTAPATPPALAPGSAAPRPTLAEVARTRHTLPGSGVELRAVAPFRQAWARVNARQRVRQGQRQEPVNAGPLNPHKLAQRTLALVDQLSPDYLLRLVHQLDALMWLEQMPVHPAPRAGGATPKTRAKRR